MPKTKEQKQEIIKDLKEKLTEQKSVVLLNFEGLDAIRLFKLRNELKDNNCQLKVTKKTLLEKAWEAMGEKGLVEKIKDIQGQMALAFGFGDEIGAAKICHNFSKDNESLKIIAGILGKDYLDQEKVIELAQLPSKEELLGRLLGSLQSPISGFASVLQGNIKGLVTVLSKIKQ